jgi:fatty-acyl-CoA synthase
MDTLRLGPTASGLAIRALRSRPDFTAFAWDGGTMTAGACLDLIGRFQRALAAEGCRALGRVALLGANRADLWAAHIAAQALRLSVTWLHTLGSLEDHMMMLEDAEIDTLIVDAANFHDRGGELGAKLGRLERVLTLGKASYGRDLQALAAAAGSAEARDLAQPDDMALLLYTGGTTGKPKGVVRTQASWAAMCAAKLADFEFPDDIRFLTVAPMTHVAGTFIVPHLLRGGTTHLMKGFDPERVLATIVRERITGTILVPTMIYVLLDHPKLATSDLSSLEVLYYGASPMSPTRLLEGLERIGPKFAQLYGQTECYPATLLSRRDHEKRRPELFASCGRPVAMVDVALLDNLQPVAAGEPGEICLRGSHTMSGYWKQPEQTAETLRGGWVHTGDVARADERGFLYIVDRKKDMIVSGGFNVFPREVEDVLTACEGVAMACVIGTPDDKWGEAVTALIVPRPGARPDPAALVQRVKEVKGSVQAPKHIEIVDALPTTPVGKVDKKVVRAKYWQGRTRMVN